jgi:hypothetical protein
MYVPFYHDLPKLALKKTEALLFDLYDGTQHCYYKYLCNILHIFNFRLLFIQEIYLNL